MTQTGRFGREVCDLVGIEYPEGMTVSDETALRMLLQHRVYAIDHITPATSSKTRQTLRLMDELTWQGLTQ